MAEKITDKIKEGISVEEIENFAKKYTTELFIVLAMIVACFSSIFALFTGPSWSLIFGTVGSVTGVFIPENAGSLAKKITNFVQQQDKTIQIVVGVVRVAVAIFLPFVIFAIIGLHAGIGFRSLEEEVI